MEFFLEGVLQFFFEFLLQIFGEIICELGMHSLAEVFQRRQVKNTWLASIGYFLLGGGVGGVSLLIVNSSIIRNPTLRILNLFLNPILSGLAMAMIGSLRQKKRQQLVRLDRFSYGFIFAFGMALIRFLYASRPSS